MMEKQIQSALHTIFLRDCLSDELVQKELELKFKISVENDPKDLELQGSVDKLLKKQACMS